MRDLSTETKCSNCRRKIKIKIKEMIPGRSKRCSCGHEIQFSGDDGRKVQRQLDKFERELKKLNRKLKF